MSPSSQIWLGLLAGLSQLRQVSSTPFLIPFLEERQASTVPDFVSTYGMQKEYLKSSAIQ
jgi:hypothetical protein